MDAGLLNSDTSIAEDVLGIQKSLDDLKDNLCLQQEVVARDFETRLRHAYDDVITDINQIRDRVNCLGSGYASESELLSCNPKRSNKTNANEFKYKKNKVKKSNLRYSRSVDFSETIDLTDGLKRFIPIERRFGQSLRRFKEMKHEILVAHNECRKLHGSQEVVKSKSLSRDAQRWAEAVAARGYAQYSDTSGTSNFTQLIWKSTTEIGVGISKFPYHDTLVVVVQYSPPGNHNIPREFQENVCPPKPIRGPKELKQNICPPIHTSAPNEFQKNASPSTQSEIQKASEKIECVPKHKHTLKECQENTSPSKHTGVSKQYQNNLKRNQQIQEPKQYHASGVETIANESDRQDLAKENTNEENERIENIAERENSIDHVDFEPAVIDKAQPEDNASLITRTTGFSTVKNDNVFVNSDSARDKATPMTGEHNDGVISCMKKGIKNAPIDDDSPTKPRRKRRLGLYQRTWVPEDEGIQQSVDVYPERTTT
ncbi:GAPR1-like protein, partial [Mya arenaria]